MTRCSHPQAPVPLPRPYPGPTPTQAQALPVPRPYPDPGHTRTQAIPVPRPYPYPGPLPVPRPEPRPRRGWADEVEAVEPGWRRLCVCETPEPVRAGGRACRALELRAGAASWSCELELVERWSCELELSSWFELSSWSSMRADRTVSSELSELSVLEAARRLSKRFGGPVGMPPPYPRAGHLAVDRRGGPTAARVYPRGQAARPPTAAEPVERAAPAPSPTRWGRENFTVRHAPPNCISSPRTAARNSQTDFENRYPT
jgi:hypothetical protein